jgi:hypothetical protein
MFTLVNRGNVAHVMPQAVGEGRSAERELSMTLEETLPEAGQYVYLGAGASPRFALRPVMLLLVSRAQPVGPEGDAPAGERWWTLRGWQLGPFGEPQLLREVRVRAGGVEVVPHPPAVGLVGA